LNTAFGSSSPENPFAFANQEMLKSSTPQSHDFSDFSLLATHVLLSSSCSHQTSLRYQESNGRDHVVFATALLIHLATEPNRPMVLLAAPEFEAAELGIAGFDRQNVSFCLDH